MSGESEGKLFIVVGDVAVENDVKNLVDTTVEKLGGLDILVANAGILGAGALLKSTVDDFDKIFAINVRGVYLCFRYAAEKMIAQGRGGRLLAASSMAGLTGIPLLSLYSSTKWAIRGLVTSVAKEVGRHGITVNAYAPGVMGTTSMWKDTKAYYTAELGLPSLDAIEESEMKETAVGYLGKPEDVANVISFLVKKESHFITGQTISVNGGRFVQ
ncbi:short chain oxidoreductase [Amanita rubescens]|nr:short chain oxidoreductase [Amanita rubescens]